jgi:hypothetical protein
MTKKQAAPCPMARISMVALVLAEAALLSIKDNRIVEEMEYSEVGEENAFAHA